MLSVSLAVAATGPVASADWHSSSPPGAVTGQATDVASRSAVLRGSVDPNGQQTTYAFEYGTTTAYGKATPLTGAGSGNNAVAVSYALAGLVPATTYHVRLVSANQDGTTRAADVVFTTPSEPAGGGSPPPSTSGTPGSSSTPGSSGSEPLAPADTPEIGKTVNVTAQSGTVLVRVPGSQASVPLAGIASVPVGAILDTRKGAIQLETALPGGHTQSGRFHGGLFSVRQAKGGGGMTELVLRGPKASCHVGGARAAATSAKRKQRTLWGSDHGGRFRTRGSNSVATVRGTSWFTADGCDGTYTRVRSGSVSVRDLHTGRTVLLRAGQSYLARAAG